MKKGLSRRADYHIAKRPGFLPALSRGITKDNGRATGYTGLSAARLFYPSDK